MCSSDLKFSPDSKTLASADETGNVNLWKIFSQAFSGCDKENGNAILISKLALKKAYIVRLTPSQHKKSIILLKIIALIIKSANFAFPFTVCW